MIILKVTKNQGFTLNSGKTTGEVKLTPPRLFSVKARFENDLLSKNTKVSSTMNCSSHLDFFWELAFLKEIAGEFAGDIRDLANLPENLVKRAPSRLLL